MGFAQAVAPIIDLIFPPRCPVCGDEGGDSGLCVRCWLGVTIPGEPACAACQRPLELASFGPGSLCAPCIIEAPRHDGIAAATLYGDATRALVLALKYRRRLGLAPMMARMISARLPALDGPWTVVPVPLHRWRLWARGFNQSVLLAHELARLRGQKMVPDLLLRVRRTPSLGGLNAKARAKTLKGAIAVGPRHAETVRGGSFLLVDDVLTSGATSDAAVSALRKAGAARVRIACFARVVDRV